MDKRAFIKSLATLGVGLSPATMALGKIFDNVENIPPTELAKDEDFWAMIREGYSLKPDYINLENGYYCMQPTETLEHFISHVREVNYQASYYMRTVQWDNKKAMAGKLADLAGCAPEELIITRNTTESLDMIIGGIHWEPGDEAVMAFG